METTEISEFLRSSRSIQKPMSLRLPTQARDEIEATLRQLAGLGRHLSRHELVLACVQEGLRVIRTRIESAVNLQEQK